MRTVRTAPSTGTPSSSDILAAGVTHKHIPPYCRITLGMLEIKFLLRLYQSLALAYCLEQSGDANISSVNLDRTFRTLISLNPSLLTHYRFYVIRLEDGKTACFLSS